jgi:hypothetical protein
MVFAGLVLARLLTSLHSSQVEVVDLKVRYSYDLLNRQSATADSVALPLFCQRLNEGLPFAQWPRLRWQSDNSIGGTFTRWSVS